jgi:hypothetical protein
MAYRALVRVGDYDFPEPSAYSGNTSTLVDSGRNVEGKMVGSVIRDNVSKVEISWKYLTVEQWKNILQCFTGKDKFINDVTFFDQSIGDWVTEPKKMYVNDRKAGMFRRDPETGDVLGWTNCALSLIEV